MCKKFAKLYKIDDYSFNSFSRNDVMTPGNTPTMLIRRVEKICALVTKGHVGYEV